MEKKITVIGTGNMGGAIARGLICAGYENISVSDKSEHILKRLSEVGAKVYQSNIDAVKNADIIIIATKPAIAPLVANEIKDIISKETVIVSICAGIKISKLTDIFGTDKIIRIMPNTPVTVGEGMCAVCSSDVVSRSQTEEVIKMFSSFGMTVTVKEEDMDAVTGISGSGPAYAYMLIEGMIRAGKSNGLDDDTAKLLAAQTVLGAAKTVLESKISPEQLKQNVCSPNGTTIEAVKVFEESDLYGTIEKAISACIRRSKELGRE